MRLSALLFTAMLLTAPAAAQETPSSPAAGPSSSPQSSGNLPVSLSKIRGALETTPLLSLSTIDERPTFRVQIQERQKLEDLLATMKFKPELVPAGGVYMAEQDRIMFPSVDNPLRQPLAAFNQPELLTIVIENLVGRYLGGKALSSISNAERTHAEAAAREDVRAAVSQYCAAQPNNGAGIQICETPVR